MTSLIHKAAEVTARERERTHKLRRALGLQHKEPQELKDSIYDLLVAAARAKGFHIQVLGRVWNKPILLFTRPEVKGPRLLIAAGVHGEEPGGVWGVLKYLQETPEEAWRHVNISFLPLVSPTAFLRGKRFNIAGDSANAYYIRAHGNARPSIEARILKAHKKLLTDLGRDGFLTMHEDGDYLDTFYVYTFEHERSLPLAKYLRAVGEKFFRRAPDDDDPEYGKRRDGIIDQKREHRDGTLEDMLFSLGVRHTATTETPVNFDIGYRARVNKALAEAFVRYHQPQSLAKAAALLNDRPEEIEAAAPGASLGLLSRPGSGVNTPNWVKDRDAKASRGLKKFRRINDRGSVSVIPGSPFDSDYKARDFNAATGYYSGLSL